MSPPKWLVKTTTANLFRIKREYCVRAGLRAALAQHHSLVRSGNSEAHRPQTACSGWGRALATCGHRPQGGDAEGCPSPRHGGPGLPVHPQKAQRWPPPKPLHRASPAGSSKAGLRKSRRDFPFPEQNSCLPTGKALVFSSLLFFFYFF